VATRHEDPHLRHLNARVRQADREDLAVAVLRPHAHWLDLLPVWPRGEPHQLPTHLGQRPPLRQLAMAPGAEGQGGLHVV